jgi:hypothetical protein
MIIEISGVSWFVCVDVCCVNVFIILMTCYIVQLYFLNY